MGRVGQGSDNERANAQRQKDLIASIPFMSTDVLMERLRHLRWLLKKEDYTYISPVPLADALFDEVEKRLRSR